MCQSDCIPLYLGDTWLQNLRGITKSLRVAHTTHSGENHRSCAHSGAWGSAWGDILFPCLHECCHGREGTWFPYCLIEGTFCSHALATLSLMVMVPPQGLSWDIKFHYVQIGLPGGSEDKESACNVRHLGSIPGLRRSPGGWHGNPLQYSCLENAHGQRSLAGYSPGGRKGSGMTKHRIACAENQRPRNMWDISTVHHTEAQRC